MSILPRFDASGYAIPWADDDAIIEAGLDDADYGEPESWPAWTDAGIWETGPETDVTVEPYEPSEDDLADYAEWADRLDTLRRLAGFTEADAIAAGLAVG